MPGKTWEPTRKGIRDLNKHIRKGTVVYTVRENQTKAPNGSTMPWVAPHSYAAHRFTWRAPFTGNWMAGHLSVEALFTQSVDGLVYEKPPAGMREIGDPGPSVSGPLGDDYVGVLDEDELRGLGKQVRDGSNPRTRQRFGGWRV